MTTALTVRSRSHDYSVSVYESLNQILAKSASLPNIFYLVDHTVLDLYAKDFDVFRDVKILPIHATEHQKSYEQITPLFNWILASGFRKDCTLFVIGGGVVQDIGCFIASVLHRGARWELVPTTLLAQADSCIGSKSSINIDRYKNQIGTFYPPHEVHMTFDVLKTLRPDEIRSGVGEIIKLGLIAGGQEWDQLKGLLARYKSEPSLVSTMVLHTLAIKKRYIEEDELDRGVRNLLNYGHTFGHAYESATQYAIPHGIAVTLGILTATYFSEKLDRIPVDSASELDLLLRDYYRPYDEILLRADIEKILSSMKLDKKNTGGSIGCILTEGPGRMKKVPLNLEEQVRPWMAEFLDYLGARTRIR